MWKWPEVLLPRRSSAHRSGVALAGAGVGVAGRGNGAAAAGNNGGNWGNLGIKWGAKWGSLTHGISWCVFSMIYISEIFYHRYHWLRICHASSFPTFPLADRGITRIVQTQLWRLMLNGPPSVFFAKGRDWCHEKSRPRLLQRLKLCRVTLKSRLVKSRKSASFSSFFYFQSGFKVLIA